METRRIPFEIWRQPNETTCGPTCLHAIYNHYGDTIDLEKLITEIIMLSGGGTYAIHLANHALKRGYPVRLYSYNMQVFDPTWFQPGIDLSLKLRARREHMRSKDLQGAVDAYLQFLRLGGELRWRDLTPALIRKYISRGVPVLTGLSATYLYQSARETPSQEYDDVRGEPSGHFVVLTGYDAEERSVHIADPYPVAEGHKYAVNIDRVLCSILLGVLTYDANLVIIGRREAHRNEFSGVRQRPEGVIRRR